MNKLKMYTYYILVGVVSFISVAFLPMLNSSISVKYKFPQTPAAWFLWVGTRISVSTLNILIFHCFVKQGDINTKDNPDRVQAENLLNVIKEEAEYKPQSPKSFFAHEYGKKIPMLLLTTSLSLFAFAPAVLTFDLVTFMTYIFTVVVALIFGVLEMFRVERYYEHDLLKYAEYKKAQEDKKEREKAQKESVRTKSESKARKNFEKTEICHYLGNKKEK